MAQDWNIITDDTYINSLAELMMQNYDSLKSSFSGVAAPLSPVTGQVWWDDTNKLSKVWDGSGWTGKVAYANTATNATNATNSDSATNADKLDGQHGSFYRNAGNLNAGTISSARLSGTYNINISGNATTATNATYADKWDGGDKIVSTSAPSGTRADGSIWFRY